MLVKSFLITVLLTIGLQGCLAYLIAHENDDKTRQDGGK